MGFSVTGKIVNEKTQYVFHISKMLFTLCNKCEISTVLYVKFSPLIMRNRPVKTAV